MDCIAGCVVADAKYDVRERERQCHVQHDGEHLDIVAYGHDYVLGDGLRVSGVHGDAVRRDLFAFDLANKQICRFRGKFEQQHRGYLEYVMDCIEGCVMANARHDVGERERKRHI